MCKKYNFKAKFANYKIVKFLKMRAKRAKICNFYVKFDTKVEKKGSLGVD